MECTKIYFSSTSKYAPLYKKEYIFTGKYV